MALQDIRKTVSIDSSGGWQCEECGVPLTTDFGEAAIDIQINHYLEHGYELLHVGQQTSLDSSGHPWQRTVAVLGKNSK
jgi:hypothetical protein